MGLRSLLLPGLAALVVAAVGLALGQSRPATSAPKASAVVSSKTASIKIANYAYQPTTLTVKAGTKLTVTNADQTAHTLTARSGTFDSGTVNPGKSAHLTLTKPGVYTYYCQFHAFMSGTVKVVR